MTPDKGAQADFAADAGTAGLRPRSLFCQQVGDAPCRRPDDYRAAAALDETLAGLQQDGLMVAGLLDTFQEQRSLWAGLICSTVMEP